jgi:ketosteroid isomerase-like protein
LSLPPPAEVFDEERGGDDELIDAGDSVVALGAFRVRGAVSGATGTQPIAAVFRLRAGRIVPYRSYLRRLPEVAGARSRVILFGRTPATGPTRAATSTSS